MLLFIVNKKQNENLWVQDMSRKCCVGTINLKIYFACCRNSLNV